MAQPPSKKPTTLSSNIRIDDPTAAFPIGGLPQVDPAEDGEPVVTPASAAAAAPAVTPAKARAPAAPPPWIVAGIDLRWVAASLFGGALLAVLVVVGIGSIVILLR